MIPKILGETIILCGDSQLSLSSVRMSAGMKRLVLFVLSRRTLSFAVGHLDERRKETSIWFSDGTLYFVFRSAPAVMHDALSQQGSTYSC